MPESDELQQFVQSFVFRADWGWLFFANWSFFFLLFCSCSLSLLKKIDIFSLYTVFYCHDKFDILSCQKIITVALKFLVALEFFTINYLKDFISSTMGSSEGMTMVQLEDSLRHRWEIQISTRSSWKDKIQWFITPLPRFCTPDPTDTYWAKLRTKKYWNFENLISVIRHIISNIYAIKIVDYC